MSQYLFDGLVATANAPSRLRARLHQSQHFADGTFSRVVFTSSRWVTKVTSCPATALLLDELLEMRDGIDGLPKVRSALGVVALDHSEPSTPPFVGYVIERLIEGALHSDATLVRRYVEYASSILNGRPFGFSSANDASLALELAQDRVFGTAAAWTFLAGFLLRHRVVLDAISARNVLLTAQGRICLADAVSFAPHNLGPRRTS